MVGECDIMPGEHAPTSMVVLADANNFFASCETVFHPELAGKPVVVLSNNDGCVVARSNEAKQLGIINGTPWFMIREAAERDHVIARSSNYELYGSLSRRMMSVLSTFLPGQEVYSIDECFMRSPWDGERTRQICLAMRRTVLQGIGIPVSVGVAPTKTLAKITNHWAKRHERSHGVTLWHDLAQSDGGAGILASIPIEDIWGVGRRLAKRLRGIGIRQAAQLRDSDPVAMRRRFSVQLERTILELNGFPCIYDDDHAGGNTRNTELLCSRMFGEPVQGEDHIVQAVSVYAQYACRRLQRQHSLCTTVSAFCTSGNVHTGIPSAAHGSMTLPDPSDDPVIIAAAARTALHGSIIPSVRYARAGVLLTGLIDADAFHTLPTLGANSDPGLSSVLEQVNRRFGPMRVGIGCAAGIRGEGRASEEVGARWAMKRNMLSQRCTTRWEEMLVVHAN
ncbi:Y-family DNA polymerase [Bifidobacterium boum]|uniref:Y-family DNA polymerase n=1 Tax=Bifidobacterium boum TaxID=78343 RepID=UPI003F8DAADC